MNETIGQRISQCRRDAGLSQEALGEKMGVSRQAISKWEADAAIPEIDKLISLSRLFGVSVGWLLGVEEEVLQNEDPALARIEELLRERPQPPKWQTPVLILTALCALLSLFLSLYTLNRIDAWDQVIQSIFSGEDQEVLPESALLADAHIHAEPWSDWQGVDLTFTLSPQQYTPEETAQIQVLQSGQILQVLECGYDQGFWVGQVSLPAGQDYEFRFLLTQPDRTQQCCAISAGGMSDLKALLEYRVQASCGSAVIRSGYFTLYDPGFLVQLPPLLESRSPTPQWDQLDLVWFLNGTEFYRHDYTYYCSAGTMSYYSHGLGVPIETLNSEDKITLYVQARPEEGPELNQMLLAWQVLEGGTIQRIYSLGE